MFKSTISTASIRISIRKGKHQLKTGGSSVPPFTQNYYTQFGVFEHDHCSHRTKYDSSKSITIYVNLQ